MSGNIRNFFVWYAHQLQVHPYKTNCITYGVMYMLVELTQQKFLHKKCNPDFNKVLERGFLGTFVQGPMITTWFQWLDWQFPGTAPLAIVKKIGLTQVLLAPLSNFSFFVGIALLDHSENVLEEAFSKVPTAYFGGIMYWIPATLINFRFVPKFYRVVYNCILGFFWTNIMFYIKQQDLYPDPSAHLNEEEDKRKLERKKNKEKTD